MTNFEIRPTDRSDAQELNALYLKSFGVLLKPDYPAEMLEAVLPLLSRANTELIDSGTYYVAANDSGQFKGAGGWSRETPGSGEVVPGHIHLRHFAVLPEASMQGIGRAIFERCIEDADTFNVIECFSTKTAQRFYQSVGFEVVREIEIPMGPDVKFSSVHMKLEAGNWI